MKNINLNIKLTSVKPRLTIYILLYSPTYKYKLLAGEIPCNTKSKLTLYDDFKSKYLYFFIKKNYRCFIYNITLGNFLSVSVNFTK